MDGLTNQRMDGFTDVPKHRLTAGQTEKQTEGGMDMWTNTHWDRTTAVHPIEDENARE